MPWCSECKRWVDEDECSPEDLSFDYPGTHCTYGIGGTHHAYGDLKTPCCDADLIDYNDEEDDFKEIIGG